MIMSTLNLTPLRLALLRAIEANTVRGLANPVSGDWWYPDHQRVHARERRALNEAGLVALGPREGGDRRIVLTDAGRQALAAVVPETD